MTSKRPVFAQFGEVWFQGGNFDRYQGNFDIGGPVEGSDGTMAYRLTGVARQSNTFLPGPGVRDDRFTIAPAFTWRPTADTTFTLLTEFQESNVPGNASFYNFPASACRGSTRVTARSTPTGRISTGSATPSSIGSRQT